MGLVTKLIDEPTKPWDPQMAAEPVQTVAADDCRQEKGKRAAQPKRAPEPASNVVNIMDAIRRSIGFEKAWER